MVSPCQGPATTEALTNAYPRQPGCLMFIALERGPPPPGDEKGFLHRILGLPGIVDDCHRQTEEAVGLGSHNLLKCGLLPPVLGAGWCGHGVDPGSHTLRRVVKRDFLTWVLSEDLRDRVKSSSAMGLASG
jgi:hypothetical protein